MQNTQRLGDLLAMLPGGIYCCDANGAVKYLSPAGYAVFGCADNDALDALSGGSIFGLLHPGDALNVTTAIAGLKEQADPLQLTHRIVHQDGGMRWVRNIVRVIVEDGERWIIGMLLDETLRENELDRLRRTEERLHVLADIDNDIIFDMDCKNASIEIFGDFQKRFGRLPTVADFQLNLCGTGMYDRLPSLTLHQYAIPEGITTEKIQHDTQLQAADGRMLWCRHQSEILRDLDGVAACLMLTTLRQKRRHFFCARSMIR